jgi:hypothetical protein
MKKSFSTIFLIGLVTLATVTVHAQNTVSRAVSAPSVTLAWDTATDPSVNGYNVYQGTQSATYTNVVSVSPATANTVTFSNLVRGVTYYWAATCVATNGLESLYSTEISYTVPTLPASPANVKLTVNKP